MVLADSTPGGREDPGLRGPDPPGTVRTTRYWRDPRRSHLRGPPAGRPHRGTADRSGRPWRV